MYSIPHRFQYCIFLLKITINNFEIIKIVHTKFTCGTTSKYIWLQVIPRLCAWHTSGVNHEFATEGCITANKNSVTWLNASIPNKESVQTGPTSPHSVQLCWRLSTSQNVVENACCVWACVVPPTVQDTLHFMHWKVMNCSDMSPCVWPPGDLLAGASMGHLPLYPMGPFSMATVSSITIPNEFHFNKPQRLCSNLLRSPNSLLTIFISTEQQGCEADTDFHLVPRSRMVELYLFSWHSP
jgi:hypothetical protein